MILSGIVSKQTVKKICINRTLIQHTRIAVEEVDSKAWNSEFVFINSQKSLFIFIFHQFQISSSTIHF